ncbi:MAG: peroxide stress protein YaaA [Chitinophagales bacterium]
MIALLSPAKKMDFDFDTSKLEYSQPVFVDRSQQLINKLSKLSRKKIGSLMSLSASLAELNYNRYHAWQLPFTTANAQQAIYAFRGDTYIGFDADSMSPSDIAFAQNHVRILSGLYGVLKPLDLIQAYRLEMSTKLPVGRKKNLYEFWKKDIVAYLNEQLKADEVIINLASNEYFKAVDTKALKAKVITCSFKEYKDGDYKMIMIFAKQGRGAMARYMVDHKIEHPEDLKGFDRNGYSYNAVLSTATDWCFTR